MDGFKAGIHALLHEIHSNYGDAEVQQPLAPHSGSDSDTYHAPNALPTISGGLLAPIYYVNQPAPILPLRLPDPVYDQAQESAGLDDFGDCGIVDINSIVLMCL